MSDAIRSRYFGEDAVRLPGFTENEMTSMDHPDLKISTVGVFKTEDGNLFEDLEVARNHARKIVFRRWYYEKNEMHEMPGDPTSSEILDWLLEHKQIVLQLYGRT